MSTGYLVVSVKRIDALKKERYMKFDELKKYGGLHVYARMEYLNQNHALVEVGSGNSFRLSEYGFSFFKKIGCEVYFSYFLLENHVTLDDLAKKTCERILKSKKAQATLSDKKIAIALNEVYRTVF